MQSVRSDNKENSDDESLFGSSPPPSPGSGKSTLALPSGGLSSEQNVGTLALPGLHNFSELPVSLVALPVVGNPQCERAQAQPLSTQPQPASCPVSIHSSPIPSSALTRVSKKNKRSRENSVAPRPDQPLIELPDSNTPLPPNFLRNQQALLGLAGMIGGVNPANLSRQRHTRGSTAQNPIIVEDEHNASSLGRANGTGSAVVNPPQSSSPSPAQIFTTLVNEKNIFPVLESILKLLASDSPSQRPDTPLQTSLSSNDSHPPKRRRMSQVPAGAVDWDTPFPFPPGQGPTNYQGEWSKERAKHLIFELIALIRHAMKKAATKNYVQQQNPHQNPYQRMGNVHGYYRPASAAYGDSAHSPGHIPVNTSHPTSNPLNQLMPHTFDSTQHSTSESSLNATSPNLPDLDGLISLLDDVISEQRELNAPSSEMDHTHPSSSHSIPDSLIDPVLLGISSRNIDEGSTSSNTPIGGGSTPALAGSPEPSSSSSMDPMTPSYDMSMFSEPDVVSGDSGSGGCDTGFSIKTSQDMIQKTSCLQFPPMSSVPAQPPASSTSVPPPHSQMVITPASTQLINHQRHSPPSESPQLGSRSSVSRSLPMASAVGRDSSSTANSTNSSQPQQQKSYTKRPSVSSSSRSISATATKQQREQLLQKAKEMRRQLVGEVGRSNVELWEMTIEHGVLVQLSKDEDLL